MERDPAATTVSIIKPKVHGNKEEVLRLDTGWIHSKAEHEVMNNSEKVGELKLWAEMNGVLSYQQVGKL